MSDHLVSFSNPFKIDPLNCGFKEILLLVTKIELKEFEEYKELKEYIEERKIIN